MKKIHFYPQKNIEIALLLVILALGAANMAAAAGLIH